MKSLKYLIIQYRECSRIGSTGFKFFSLQTLGGFVVFDTRPPNTLSNYYDEVVIGVEIDACIMFYRLIIVRRACVSQHPLCVF